jgi:ubiquinone/menaquinone biosynthesis C-methylase UbiE
VPLDSTIYDRDYFLSDLCEGFNEFDHGRGLSPLKERLVARLDPGPGDRVLDAGCGRGEVLLACAARGSTVAGIDYSTHAVELSRQTLAEVGGAEVVAGDVTDLPWPDSAFDLALFGDVIEHLDPAQEPLALAELRRVLRPGGRLLVHTAPNKLFLQVGWRVSRPAMRVAGRGAAADELDRWIAQSKRYHVNEKTVFGLRKGLRRAGFEDVRAWVDPDVLRSGQHHLTEDASASAPLKAAARIAGLKPLRTFLGNDLYAWGVAGR